MFMFIICVLSFVVGFVVVFVGGFYVIKEEI